MRDKAINRTSTSQTSVKMQIQFYLKHIIPRRQRQQLRVIYMLCRRPDKNLTRVLASVQLRSLSEVLACFEEIDTRPSGLIEIWVRGVKHPLQLRTRTTDFAVFQQVILGRQYKLPVVPEAEYIIDAGANVGFASVYFLSQNPNVRVVAIEPDSENFVIAQENLKPYGERCRLVHGAVWSRSGRLAVHRGSYGDGGHWATQTKPLTDGSKDTVRAYTVDELIEVAGFPRVDLLKMDIEGAELQVFRDGPTGFLAKTRCCAVECHDDHCVAAYTAAIEAAGMQSRVSTELLIAEHSYTTS